MSARFQQAAVAWIVLTLFLSLILSAFDIPFWASAVLVGLVLAVALFLTDGFGPPSIANSEHEAGPESEADVDVD